MTEDKITEIVSMIRKEFPDCAITLSLGEMEYESYKRFFDAGANRYLLRHETADARHYGKLHPKEMSFEHRELPADSKGDRITRPAAASWSAPRTRSRRGHDLYPGTSAGDGGNRAVYSAA